PDESDGRINAFTATIFVLYGIAGTMIARRHPGNAVGWILCLIGVLVAFSSIARQYAIYSLITEPGALPGGITAAWLNNWLGISWAFLAIVYLPLLFPDGRLPSRRWRLVAWLAALGTVLVVLFDAFARGALDRWPPLENPYAAPEVAGTVVKAFEAGYFLLPVCGLAAVASLIVRLRRARGDERAQLQWFMLGAAAVVAGAIGVFLLEGPLGLPHGVAVVPQMLSFAAVPIVVAIAILKYHLYDIDVVINRTLVYATLTALVVAAYALAVSVAGAVVPGDSFVVSLAATGVIAVLFQPVRERVQRGVNRLLYGERDEPYRVFSRLGRRLEGTLAPETVLPTIVQTVREALNVPYAAVALAGDDETAAASGTPTGEPLRLPLVYQNEAVGELHVAPRRPGEAFGPADRRLLED
ncbi:MAG: GAF domain-containing sensor histidine kinase, partial [Dehalococcoidia bacterium]